MGSLKSTVSAKRSLKIERITLSGTAVRHKRCTFVNIKVSMAMQRGICIKRLDPHVPCPKQEAEGSA